MAEKHIDFDIDDPRSGKIAEVLGNKTCKNILALLAEKEMSAGEIASALGIPVNTATYNIDKLLDSGLIEKVKGFLWSVKGKKIEKYKASNKKIIISPRKMMSTPLAVISSMVVVLVILGIVFGLGGFNGGNNPKYVSGNESNGLKQFSSYDELKDFVKNSSANSGSYQYGLYNRGIMANVAPTALAAGEGALGSDAAKSSSQSLDYSNTNVQVAGIDEPDFVKNDGKYIYVVSNNRLFIVAAYPADQMKIIKEMDFNGTSIGNIFVNGDKLIVFAQDYGSLYYRADIAVESVANMRGVAGVAANVKMVAVDSGAASNTGDAVSSGMPIRQSMPKTEVLIYNIADRQSPELEQNISIDGSFYDARMKGDYVYLISNEHVYNDVIPMYEINGVAKSVAIDNIYYPPYYDSGYTFTSISSINVNNEEFNTKVYMIGSSSVIYASENNIYLTYVKYTDYRDYGKRMIREAVLPLLSGDLKDNVEKALDEGTGSGLQDAMQLVQDYSMNLKGDEKEKFDWDLQKAIQEFIVKMAKENEKTIIHKISYDSEKINYEGNGEFPGTLLNKYSMDEYAGNLRVATTFGNNWETNSSNNVYVLDNDLKVVGQIEGIAEGERIYSARFMADRAYVVTFKTVDPLFVIDLGNPESPKVLGYLKIPGYSDYLHPYDENHVIGIGKDVNESIDADKVHSSGSVYYTAIQGVKIALFDVSDVEHPVENANYIIGQRGTDTPASYDPKAFLFSKEKNLLVIPVNSYSYDNIYSDNWQGVYVFDITADNISLKGKITHNGISDVKLARDEPIGAERNDSQGNVWTKTADDNWVILEKDRNGEIVNESWGTSYTGNRGYDNTVWGDSIIDEQVGGATYESYDYNLQIQRSLYMDNTLYTVSFGKIMANDLDSLDKINEVKLPVSNYYPYQVLY